MAKNKIIPLILIIVGVALIFGVGLFMLDRATSSEPDGLGTWIFAVLGLILGAAAGIKGWLDWKKKDTPSQVSNITANDDAQVAIGDHGRNVRQGDNSQYIETFNEAPKSEKSFSPLHQLPQPPADFTGRETLINELTDDFSNAQGATISGLTGMGGIGKTALGLKVAHKIAENYQDAQIFLDLKGTTAPLSALDIARHVILSFEPTADLRGLDESNFQPVYQSVLHGKKALLFFDNARSADQIAPLTPPETCAMLVTSRWTFSVPGLRQRRVDVMGEGEAKDFLLELCPRIGDKATELAEACGYLPLALRIAGSYLKVNDHLSVDKYLNDLMDRTKRLSGLEDSHQQSELGKEHPNLVATFDLSYRQLAEEDQKRWRMLGVFPATFASTATQALWELDEKKSIKILGLFRRYSLLEYDQASSRYTLHDLLADYAMKKLNNKEMTFARINHSVHYSKFLTSINQDLIKGGERISRCLQLYDIETLNIELGQQTSVEYLERYQDAVESCNNFALQGSIIGFRQRLKDQIQWFENGLKASKILNNKEHIADHLGNLGTVHAKLGYAKRAIEFYEQQREIAREIGDRYGEGNSTGNLAIEYMNLNDIPKAIELFEQALAITQEIGDRLYESNWLGNLGNAYAKTGDTDKAIEFYNRRLKIAREIGDRFGENSTLGNLGIFYSQLGDNQKAVEYYKQALSFHREVNDRQSEGLALGNLGTAYAESGNVDKAIMYFEQALQITRETGMRRDERNWLFNLVVSYEELGDINMAINFYKQILVIDRELDDLGSEVETLRNLGIAYVSQGDAQNAFESFKQEIAGVRKIGDREKEGHAIANMGLALLGMGKKDEALALVKDAIVILEECKSPLVENVRTALKKIGKM